MSSLRDISFKVKHPNCRNLRSRGVRAHSGSTTSFPVVQSSPVTGKPVCERLIHCNAVGTVAVFQGINHHRSPSNEAVSHRILNHWHNYLQKKKLDISITSTIGCIDMEHISALQTQSYVNLLKSIIYI